MQLTAILLTVCSLTVAARTASQSVTFSGKNVELEKIFIVIEQQTGYFIFYEEGLLKDSKPVTISTRNMKLDEFLSKLFAFQPLTYSLQNTSIIIERKPVAHELDERSILPALEVPPIKISGTVIGNNNQPLAGATVRVKGKNIVATTDERGYFELDAEVGSILLVSYVGFKAKEVKTENESPLRIELVYAENNLDTTEIVINTGYQQTSKARTTGAFNKIDKELIQQQTSPNILDRLKNVSNVYFDTKNTSTRKTDINIRGLSTIQGVMAPLIVLDNFPYNGNISDINPEDVESITILKDATAASIWGAKSANGVIVITTKKSFYNQPVTIDFATTISTSDLPSFMKPYDMSIADYIDVEKYLFERGYRLSGTTSPSHPPFTPVYEMLMNRSNGLISAEDSVNFIRNLLNVNTQDQYRNSFYRNAITQQYTISLRGGGKNFNWTLSGAYNKGLSTLKSNGNEKKNLRVENRFKPVKGLEIGTNLFYTQTNTNNSPTPTYNSITIGSKVVPYLVFADEQGNPARIDRYYRGSFTDTIGGGRLLDWNYYPLNDYQYNHTTNIIQNLLFGVSINYNFLRGFNLSLNFQQEQQQSDTRNLYEKASYYTRNLINLYTVPGTPLDNPLIYNIPPGDILARSSQKKLARYGRAQLSYQETWNQVSYVGLAGAEISETKFYDGNSSTFYGYSEDPLSYSTLSFNTYYPTYLNGSQRIIPGAPRLNASSFIRFVSGFMNNELTIKQRYIINASLRSDASNTFGLNTNDKWNPFWSVGVGWNISNEKFFRTNIFSFLKLRATLGIGGNVDPSKTALPVATAWNDPATNFYALNIYQINNPSLKWEQSKQLNLAVDFEAINRRVSGSLDFYLKKGTNLYGPSPIDYTSWGKTDVIVKNVAAMKGKGVELSLQTKNTTGPVKWTSNFIFNYNESKTSEYYYQLNPSNIYYFILGGGAVIVPVVGKPLYAIAAYKWGGLDSNGDPQGYINGELSTDYNKIRESAYKGDQSGVVYIGQQDPKFFGSLINKFNYKKWNLSFNISYKLGHYFQRPVLSYSSLYSGGLGNNEYKNRWQKPGDESRTNVPAMVYTDYPNFSGRDEFYSASEINYLKADHVRLEYINLAYTFSFKRRAHYFLKELSLVGNITNLGIIWRKNKEKLDPDSYYTNSIPRQYSLSIRASL